MRRVWLVFMAAGMAGAQAPAVKAPEVPAALVTKVFKAQAELAQAEINAQRASQIADQKQKAFKSVADELTKLCGEKFQPEMSQSGDPVCAAKPAK